MKTYAAALLFAAITCAAQEHETPGMNKASFDDSGKKDRLLFTLRSDQGTPPPENLPVEKQPVPIQSPAPVYPETARRTGLEGTAWVKLWIDVRGNAHQAVVIKSDNDIFNQPSIDAAMQWTFKPAMLHDKPVAVWVTIPFKYKLSKSGTGNPGGEGKRPTK